MATFSGSFWGLLIVSAMLLLVETPQQPVSTPNPANQNAPAPADAAKTSNGSAPPTQQDLPTAPSASPTESSPAQVFKATTRLVQVDVVVEDKGGKPIFDLKKEDFELRENGQPQKIVAFALQQPGASHASAKRRVVPPGYFTNLPAPDEGAGPPTVLLVDGLNTPFKEHAYMRQQVLKYLDGLEARRNVAIYTLGSRLRLLQDFTNDPQLLHAALKKVTNQASSLNMDSGVDPFAGLDPDSSDETIAGMAQSVSEFEAELETAKIDQRKEITLDALRRIARNLSGYPGRKNLIWLSGSFPVALFPDGSATNAFDNQRDYSTELRKTAGILSDSQVAVYPVDSRGLVGGLLPDATMSARPSRHNDPIPQLQKSSLAVSTAHLTMEDVADRTGGRAFYNTNDLNSAISTGVAEGSTYYNIAYYPENKKWDGAFRKVEVKLARKGLQMRYRKGYFANDLEALAKDDKTAVSDFSNALLPEAPISTALPFVVHLAPSKKDEPTMMLDFTVEPRAVTFEPQGELQHIQVDFVIRAFDLKGKPVGTESKTLDAMLKADAYAGIQKRGLIAHEGINLAAGTYLLKVGVRDAQSNVFGTLVAKVEVKEPKT